MADRDELFYRPDIPAPVRKGDIVPDGVISERAYMQEELGAGIPAEDIPDPLTAFELRFADYAAKALQIKERAFFLMDKTIEDLDLYVGDAPLHVLRLITDLADIHFTDPLGEPLPRTDPAYTLGVSVAKCIFRVAGAYEPRGQEKDLLNSAKTFNAAEFKRKVTNKLQSSSYLKQIFYGLTLLVIVLKMAHVIAVHYTVGWVCGFFKGKLKIGFKIKVPVIDKHIGWNVCIGDLIADKILHPIEVKLLKLVGYKCQRKGAPRVKCDRDGWRKLDFKRINCCKMDPIFFGDQPGKEPEFIQAACFEKWIKMEMDPDFAGQRTICSLGNSDDKGIEPNEYERAAAGEVAKYLETRPSVSGIMGRGAENIKTLSRSIEAADAGIVMTDTIQSSIKNQRGYQFTGNKIAPWDCFGVQDQDNKTPEERMMAAVNKAAGQWLPKGNGTPIVGNSSFKFLEVLDNVLAEILTFADKMVSCVANLSRWGSSKQLCCYIYMIVAIASVWKALIKKGSFCPGMEEGEAVRNELGVRWASDLRSNKDLKQFTALLQVIKQIVDIFIARMHRQIMISGLTLPLGEMWEMIKVTIANGLSEFLDIIFGPLDQVLAGIRAIPEIRHMINNECFGFDKFLDFLLCLLGNLKWGILNQIMKILDFTIPDMVLLNDIMLTRMRLKSLEALSKLLGAIINLILGLRDCYDPKELVDQIVKQEVVNEYQNAKALVNLAGSAEALGKFDEYSVPIMADPGLIGPSDQTYIDGLQGGMASQFGDFGPAAKEILDNAITAPMLSVAKFINPKTGNIVSFGDFTVMMEEMTGTTVSEIQESMRYIFDILKGQSNESV